MCDLFEGMSYTSPELGGVYFNISLRLAAMLTRFLRMVCQTYEVYTLRLHSWDGRSHDRKRSGC